MKKTIEISGMTCGHCSKRVENALLDLDGISSVVVNLADKLAVIEAEEDLRDAIIIETIDEVGYKVEAIS